MKRPRKALLCLLIIIFPAVGSGQQVGIKTNLLYWGTTTPNFGVEIALNPKNTLEIGGGYNPFRLSGTEENKKLQHWKVSAEWRHWIYEKFDGHFLGIQGLFGSYNAGGVKLPLGIWSDLKDHRYEGYMGGVGLNYGYQWTLGPHWNLEASFGFGYAYLNYDKYECPRCGEHFGKETRHYFGPTKVGLSFVYLIKSKRY